MRADLMALSADDLATMANRGLVKRAQKEVETPDLTAEWDESADGTIKVKWSDQVSALIPGGKTLKESTCTCGSFEMCRHVIRTVLAWQVRQKEKSAPSGCSQSGDEEPQVVQEAVPPQAWDPGAIADDVIHAQVPRAIQDKAQTLWNQGILVELLRSAKPVAQFHFPGHTVRLLVPNDLRYATCSCPDPAPCVHAHMAVKAFRLLLPERKNGFVIEGSFASVVNESPLRGAESAIRELLEFGLGSLSLAWRDRVRRLAEECNDANLVWPGSILEELAEDFDHYHARNAAFDPMEMLKRTGELLVRIDAIIAGTGPVPQPFIRGMKTERDTELGTIRLIGLGARVDEGRTSTRVTVFMQDSDTSHTMIVIRDFNELMTPEQPGPGFPTQTPVNSATELVRKPFTQLARATAVKSSNLAQLASGQLISQGGKRTAGGKLIIGRARSVVNPQNFQWERLKAPVLVDDFQELWDRLLLLPPASFRPRRAGADFHVCPIASIEAAGFDADTNSVVAVVLDAGKGAVFLTHPWTERGSDGAEALLHALRSDEKPLFIAGHFRIAGSRLLVRPTALVVEGKSGRRIIMPWLDTNMTTVTSNGILGSHLATRTSVQSRFHAGDEWVTNNLLLNGLTRTKNNGWPVLQPSVTELDQLGYHRIAGLLQRLPKAADPIAAAFTLLKILTLARDMG